MSVQKLHGLRIIMLNPNLSGEASGAMGHTVNIPINRDIPHPDKSGNDSIDRCSFVILSEASDSDVSLGGAKRRISGWGIKV